MIHWFYFSDHKPLLLLKGETPFAAKDIPAQNLLYPSCPRSLFALASIHLAWITYLQSMNRSKTGKIGH